ncbi:hypothetical protein NM688_g8831 [Phlebia brevispora]|uniref:Uncharacterized protein n=1 Tax=Phlebia brevispora TaxID=194682 RepID=A0ACC1RNQ3_9APHY|nr:hypothetical protein NM688_g8831 [Phlebia brevispora]
MMRRASACHEETPRYTASKLSSAPSARTQEAGRRRQAPRIAHSRGTAAQPSMHNELLVPAVRTLSSPASVFVRSVPFISPAMFSTVTYTGPPKLLIWIAGCRERAYLQVAMPDIRVVRFDEPRAFLDAVKDYDDSFMNFSLGALLDSLEPANPRGKEQPATSRTLLAVYKGEQLIITFTRIRDGFPCVLAIPRGVEEHLSSQDITNAVERLVVLLSDAIDPKLLDRPQAQNLGLIIQGPDFLRHTGNHPSSLARL